MKESLLNMVNLAAAPFFLDERAITWVNDTIASMSLEDKVGQLFINHNHEYNPDYIDTVIDRYRVGGIRYRPGPANEIQEHIRYAQARSRIPLLVASNPEMGGRGSSNDGTFVATHLQAGAAADSSVAYEMGRIAGLESVATGCNWAFAPVVDIHLNWRNTVVSTRSFGNDADLVLERAKAYFDGASESRIVCAIKHFPGDGVDERDQHVVTSYNTLGWDEWNSTFGHVYRELIAHGVQSVMVGHIAAPELSRKFSDAPLEGRPLPATLAPELLNGLLREELGFNGLIVTDASRMVGITQAMRREEMVPGAIAAGCDMFLFFGDPEEDLRYMLEGIESGVVTEQRLQDALERILGLKASLGLHLLPKDQLVASPDALEIVGCEAHVAAAATAADKTITLVKDTAGTLPLSPTAHKRIRLYEVHGSADFTLTDPSAFINIVKEELEAVGFQIDIFQRTGNGSPLESFELMANEARNYRDRYDAAILVANVKGFAQDGAIRIHWPTPMAPEIPWYVTEVPTVFISLHQPNHLIDVPMVQTAIHAYADTRPAIKATVQKLVGKSEFVGSFNENVFCDSPDTRF